MRRRLAPAFIALALLAPGMAVAQQPSPAPPSAPGAAPYDTELLRLAEILGALHWLRPLCATGEGQVWREEMQELLEGEAPTADRRERLIASFNRGYSGFRATHRTCTAASELLIRRYLDEGQRLSRTITGRFSN